MMKCREYIFQLTSGQLQDAPKALRLEAAMHRMMCKYCRTFTRNDATLDRMLAGYRESLQQPDDAEDKP
jgi:hypothetical protein